MDPNRATKNPTTKNPTAKIGARRVGNRKRLGIIGALLALGIAAAALVGTISPGMAHSNAVAGHHATHATPVHATVHHRTRQAQHALHAHHSTARPQQNRPVTTTPSASPPTTRGIPQGNGGDQDGDNNGGSSDGDGNI